MADPVRHRRGTPARDGAHRRLLHGHGALPPRPASREQAVQALAQGVEACAICRADSGLGILEA
ncbi:DUF6233 domain-containing protein [Streptomyces sp. NBC_00853]|uniref:DUF6233 domain-containing protein n=1 Tax=Streptomyces sp. NBC_00853 TaxID=2903681 RepID=UPI003872CE5E